MPYVATSRDERIYWHKYPSGSIRSTEADLTSFLKQYHYSLT